MDSFKLIKPTMVYTKSISGELKTTLTQLPTGTIIICGAAEQCRLEKDSVKARPIVLNGNAIVYVLHKELQMANNPNIETVQ